MADWPISLPPYPRKGSFVEGRSSNYRSFEPDLGAPLVAAANSVSYQTWTGTYDFSDTQLDTFWTFWDTTLSQGVGQFNITHPRTGATVVAEFKTPWEPPSTAQQTKGHHSVELSFRVIP